MRPIILAVLDVSMDRSAYIFRVKLSKKRLFDPEAITIRRHTAENMTLQQRCCENLTSPTLWRAYTSPAGSFCCLVSRSHRDPVPRYLRRSFPGPVCPCRSSDTSSATLLQADQNGSRSVHNYRQKHITTFRSLNVSA